MIILKTKVEEQNYPSLIDRAVQTCTSGNISLTRPDLHPTFFVLCQSKCILPPVKRLPDVFLSRVFSLLSNGFYFIVNSQHCFLAVLRTLYPHFLRTKKDCQSILNFQFLNKQLL